MTQAEQVNDLTQFLSEVEGRGWIVFRHALTEARRNGKTQHEALQEATEAAQLFVREQIEARIKDQIIEDFVQSVIAEVVGPGNNR